MLLLVVAARAAEPCATALTAEELYAMDARSNLAVQSDDPEGHAAVVHELAERVACLEGPIPQGPWARMLVNETIVRYAQQEPWEHVLATALEVDAGVANVPGFVREAYRAPDSVAGAAAPAGVRLFVDGRQTDTLPPARGMHVVQRELEDGWHSVLLVDARVPDALLVPPPQRTVPGWSTVGLLVSAARWSQSPDDPGDFLAAEKAGQTRVGVASHGRVPFLLDARLGLAWDAALGTEIYTADTLADGEPATAESRDLTVRPGGSAFVGAGFGGPVAAVLGGGAVVLRSHTRTADAVHVAPLPWLGVQASGDALDAAAGFGIAPRAWNGSVRAGWSPATRIRFGVHVDAAHMSLAQLGDGAPAGAVRRVGLTQITAGATAGLRFGP
ncbi:MAG: hypothetical protein H6737_04880 [Alphaproteobacteria bacterium]|nr:hypothetical protein [Alphaproteobacteria bacterium]